ncbi:MAG: hypothetical protein RLZZ444_3278, partial [Pseudomonadota bacterium]
MKYASRMLATTAILITTALPALAAGQLN